ncbi:unnamed protein product [Sphagnum jensenii]|uniref:DUF569 domain-containing protein n=1 Tax=Sphagnum jensenii TaxID=128206 RepID=A0ABP0X997_9BRYO
MDFFQGAKTVRLKSHHGKYLCADDDHHSVSQDRHKSSKAVLWQVELVDPVRSSSNTTSTTIRLKSCYALYLTASDHAFLLGMTGKKVLQNSHPPDASSCEADAAALEWEPIAAAEGKFVKLKTKLGGNFLRANGGPPPWRNSVTHDIPVRSATHEWIYWEVDIMEHMSDPEPELITPTAVPKHTVATRVQAPSVEDEDETPLSSLFIPRQSRSFTEEEQNCNSQLYYSPRKPLKTPASEEDNHQHVPSPFATSQIAMSEDEEQSTGLSAPQQRHHDNSGHRAEIPEPSPTWRSAARSDARRIFYRVVNDNQGEAAVMAMDDKEWASFVFKGHSLKHLTEQLHAETGIDDDIILCARHPLSAKLYPMQLELPPNKSLVHVVVVRASSPVGRKFSRPKSLRPSHQDDDDNKENLV